LMESGQRFAFDAGALSQLADAGVPARVTDAIVNASREAVAERRGDDREHVVEHVVTVYDPWVYGYGYRPLPYPVVRYAPVYRPVSIGFNFSLFGFGYVRRGYSYVPFGYYPYAYRPVVYSPFSFNVGFGSPRHYGPSVRVPVVINRTGHGTRYEREPEHGRADRDHGYTAPRRDYNEQRRDNARTETQSRSVMERSRDQSSGNSRQRSAPEASGRQQQQPTSRQSETNRSAHTRH
jgi:hypothetical protein